LRIAWITVSKNVPKPKVCHKVLIKEIFWDILYYIIYFISVMV